MATTTTVRIWYEICIWQMKSLRFARHEFLSRYFSLFVSWLGWCEPSIEFSAFIYILQLKCVCANGQSLPSKRHKSVIWYFLHSCFESAIERHMCVHCTLTLSHAVRQKCVLAACLVVNNGRTISTFAKRKTKCNFVSFELTEKCDFGSWSK